MDTYLPQQSCAAPIFTLPTLALDSRPPQPRSRPRPHPRAELIRPTTLPSISSAIHCCTERTSRVHRARDPHALRGGIERRIHVRVANPESYAIEAPNGQRTSQLDVQRAERTPPHLPVRCRTLFPLQARARDLQRCWTPSSSAYAPPPAVQAHVNRSSDG